MAMSVRPTTEKYNPSNPNHGTSRKVVFLKDYMTRYPSLGLEVFVQTDDHEKPAFARLFALGGCSKADSPEKADLVVFGGGVDVNPILYDETAHKTSSWDGQRDEEDLKLFEYCIMNGIPMLGVCRGAQFLHVMMGGKLYQDVDNHIGDHDMWDVARKKFIPVSSVHHQMVIYDPSLEMTVLGTSGRANMRWRNDTHVDTGCKPDVEAYAYEDAAILGVQGHPEYTGYDEFAKWTLDAIDEMINKNPDMLYKDGNWRLADDVQDRRSRRWEEMVDDKRTIGGVC